MTVTPQRDEPQGEPLTERKPFISTEGLLFLTLGGIATAATLVNPAVGIAIGVGLAVIGLLIKLT